MVVRAKTLLSGNPIDDKGTIMVRLERFRVKWARGPISAFHAPFPVIDAGWFAPSPREPTSVPSSFHQVSSLTPLVGSLFYVIVSLASLLSFWYSKIGIQLHSETRERK